MNLQPFNNIDPLFHHPISLIIPPLLAPADDDKHAIAIAQLYELYQFNLPRNPFLFPEVPLPKRFTQVLKSLGYFPTPALSNTVQTLRGYRLQTPIDPSPDVSLRIPSDETVYTPPTRAIMHLIDGLNRRRNARKTKSTTTDIYTRTHATLSRLTPKQVILSKQLLDLFPQLSQLDTYLYILQNDIEPVSCAPTSAEELQRLANLILQSTQPPEPKEQATPTPEPEEPKNPEPEEYQQHPETLNPEELATPDPEPEEPKHQA